MQFSLFDRIEKIFPYPTDLSAEEEWAIQDEFGAEAVMMIRSWTEFEKVSSEDLEKVKQSILKHKREKDYVFGTNDRFFKFMSIQDVKDMVIQQVIDEEMFGQYDPDGTMLELLSAYTTDEVEVGKGHKMKVKGSALEPMKEDLKRIIQQYIKHGYNPYPMMNSINARSLKSKSKEEKAQGMAINQMLENCERAFSPYHKVFKTSEHLGELINRSKELEKKGEFDEMEKVDEEITKYQEKIKKTLGKSSYDLVELEEILAGKSKYIKESEKGFNHESVNYDMYQGLLAVKKLVHYEHKKTFANQTAV